MTGFLSVITLLVVLFFTSPSHAQFVTPDWLRFLADGFDGSYSCRSGNCNLTDEHWVTSFNVSAGATVYTQSNGPFIVRSTGPCTVAGLITNSPNSNFSGGQGVSGQGDFGGGGGGGGGGAFQGNAGQNTVGDAGIPIVLGGNPGAPSGGPGGNGRGSVPPKYRALLEAGTYWPTGGSVGAYGANGGGAPGDGGGPVILVCNSISFTGTIDVSGGPGKSAPANNTGAGGGGGGGWIILAAKSFPANTGVAKVSGGAGGSCNGHSGCGAGGAGGNGWAVSILIH